ncbi:MAG: pyridoxal phosphate-dependent aminotransferase [Bifidobacteriaceae bacterium]|nr:pyridoxal phosphate-dependent aminotransferase [Bifidobacteriaceae bacterium]
MFRFSSRVNISQPNPIAVESARLKAAGIKVGQLNDSNPTRHKLAPSCLDSVYLADPKGPLFARKLLSEHIARRDNARRDNARRESVREDSDNPANPDNLYILSSTSQAYAWLFAVLCNAGEAVAIPKPGYPLIESIAGISAVETVAYGQFYDGSWTTDLGVLRELFEKHNGRSSANAAESEEEAMFSEVLPGAPSETQLGKPPRIKAIVLINPNNPTGAYIKKVERETIVSLCREYGVAIIADEVFFDYELEVLQSPERLAGENRVLTFALDGLSKSMAAPHAKVGWIRVSGPEKDVEKACEYLDVVADDFLPVSSAVADRFEEFMQSVDAQTRKVSCRTRQNLKTLRKMVEEDENSVVSVLRAEGGWSVLARIPSVFDENEVALRLLSEYRLASQPGYFFDMVGDGYFALSLLAESEEFKRNVEAFLNVVNSMPQS